MGRRSLALSVALSAGQAFAVSGTLVPDDGVMLSVGQDIESIGEYVSAVGTQPAGVTNYVGIANLDGLSNNADAGAGRNNVAELAATYPDRALVVGVSMNGVIDQVAAGDYNANIDTLLNTLGGYNRPVYLRWAYEVDGPWNNHNPAAVKSTFEYVHNRIEQLGFDDRIALVWQTATYCPVPINPDEWYPGDDVVDWVGISYFAPQDCNWAEVRKVADFAVTHNKPLFINESTPQRYKTGALTYSPDAAFGSNAVNKSADQIWNEWYQPYFDFIAEYSSGSKDVLRGITYINANWDAQPRWNPNDGVFGPEGYWGDSRVQANNTILTRWENATDGSDFIRAGASLFDDLNFGDQSSSNPQDPDVNLVAQNGEVIAGDSFSVDVSASDADGSVVSVSLYLTAPGASEVLVGTEQSASASFNVTTSAVGSYGLRAVATDNDGNTDEASATKSVVADNNGGGNPTPSEEFGIRYIDDSTLQLFHQDNPDWEAGFAYLCLDSYCLSATRAEGLFTRNFSGTLGQTYSIEFKVQDNETGQYTVQDQATFTQTNSGSGTGAPSNTAPSVAANAVAGVVVEGGIVSVDVNANDSDGSVATVALHVSAPGAEEALVGQVAGNLHTFDVVASTAGNYQFRAVATDNEGATAETTISKTVVQDSGANATPTSLTLEAESATVFGGAQLYPDSAASGGQGVAYISNNGAGLRIASAPAADTVSITYASEQSGNITLRVNGVDVSVPFTSTGSWVGNYNTVSLNTQVPEGATVELRYQNGNAAMNVDLLDFTLHGGSGNPVANQAPSVSLNNIAPAMVGDTVNLTANASDSDGTISEVALYATVPGASETLVSTKANAPFGFSVTVDQAGTWQFRVAATDDDGATATANTSVQVSDEPVLEGTVGITSPVNGASFTEADAVTLSFNVNNWPVAQNDSHVHYFINGEDQGPLYSVADVMIADLTIGTHTLAVELAEADHTLTGVRDQVSIQVTAMDDGSSNGGDEPFGVSGATLWFAVQDSWPDSGTFYLCRDLEADCYTASLNGDRYEHTFANLSSGNFTAQLKVPGFSSDQFPRYDYSTGGATGGDNGGNTGGNDGGGDPGGNIDPDSPYAHLDWTSNSLTDGEIGPPPRANPIYALATPENGHPPTSHGFAFDIDGDQLTWRWGQYIIKQTGDSGLEMHCSDDGDLSFKKVAVTGGTATIPCSGDYNYYFRYLHPNALNDNPATQWIWTGLFTTQGARVNPYNYEPFVDGSSNWMRFRHPITQDGTTAAVLDAHHNNDRLRNLDRYTIWAEDTPGDVHLGFGLNGSILRNESMRNTAGGPNGQQFFALTQNPGFDSAYSYGQVISFEVTAVAGATGAQTYNDFSHYVVGCGWCGKYGDPRLNPAGKAGTSQVFSDSGGYIDLEHNAIFTQPMVTLHKEDMVDDFILGHHLFHGIDPNKLGSHLFNDPDAQIGNNTCGNCHFRDGRGTEPVNVPGKGMRLPPPVYGVKLLEAIEGREAGFNWEGSEPTVADQVKSALVVDHGVDPAEMPPRLLELLTTYVEVLTVPARDPGTYSDPAVSEGEVLFTDIGCASCHTPVQHTRADAPTHLRNLTIRPYTDMQTWDLGEGEFRTAPLWGIGQNIHLLERNGHDMLYMHDGASTSVADAIGRHGGDAQSATSAYNNLTASQQQAVQAFVKTL